MIITFRVRRSRGEMYIGHARLCVCLYGVLFSCALLGGFAIGARVSLLCQHSAEREMSATAVYWFYAWC